MTDHPHILFDLDGTLSDSGPGIMHGVEYAMAHFGVRDISPETLRSFIGPPLYDSFSRWFGLSREEADRAVQLYREYYLPKGMFENTLYPGILPLLERLRAAGKRLYVCTSKPYPTTVKVLEYLKISAFFTAVTGATMDRTLNEKPALIARLMEEQDIGADAVMVGDTRFDVEGAAACGLPAIAVTWGYGSAEELSGAARLAHTPEELGNLLLGEEYEP